MSPAQQSCERAFQTLQRQLPGAWFHERRVTAFRYFQAAGFPGPELESWRYSDLSPWLRLDFEPASVPTVPPLSIDGPLPGEAHDELVFVGGHYCQERSRIGPLPPRVRLAPLCQVLGGGRDERLAQFLDDLPLVEGGAEAGFQVLNTALFSSGLFLEVPDGVRLERPVHVLHLDPELEVGGPPRSAQLRNLCLIGRGAAACVYESYGPAAAATSTAAATPTRAPAPGALVNSVTQLRLEERAELRHCKLLRGGDAAQLAYSCMQLGAHAHLHSCYFGDSDTLARNELQVRLLGPGARVELNGLYSASGKGRHSCPATVRHLQAHTHSDTFYRGILDESAQGVFHGAVHILKEAAHSEALQSNASLLLAQGAHAYSRPELRIHTDEVACRHGATVGQLDETAAFYLRSRGLEMKQARAILVSAFAAQALRRFHTPEIQGWLDRHVLGKSSGGERGGAMTVAGSALA